MSVQALLLILEEGENERGLETLNALCTRWVCGTAIQLGASLWVREGMKWWFREAAVLPSEKERGSMGRLWEAVLGPGQQFIFQRNRPDNKAVSW